MIIPLIYLFCRYKKIINCLENVQLRDSLEEKEMNELLTKAYTNLAICYNKINLPRNACIACKRAPVPTAKTHYKYANKLIQYL